MRITLLLTLFVLFAHQPSFSQERQRIIVPNYSTAHTHWSYDMSYKNPERILRSYGVDMSDFCPENILTSAILRFQDSDRSLIVLQFVHQRRPGYYGYVFSKEDTEYIISEIVNDRPFSEKRAFYKRVLDIIATNDDPSSRCFMSMETVINPKSSNVAELHRSHEYALAFDDAKTINDYLDKQNQIAASNREKGIKAAEGLTMLMALKAIFGGGGGDGYKYHCGTCGLGFSDYSAMRSHENSDHGY